MRDSFNLRSTGAAALLALILVVASFAGASTAATPTNQTPTAPNGSTTVLADGAVLEGFNANASNATLANFSFDTAPDGSAALNVTDGNGTAYYTNTNPTETDATNNTYEWNISNDELADIPIEANQNKSFTVHVYDTNDKANATNFTIYADATGERSLIRIGDALADNDDVVTFSELGILSSVPFIGSDIEPATVEETVAVDGQNTSTITFDYENESVQDAFTTSAEDADVGAWLPLATVKVNDHYVATFADEAPDNEWIDTNSSAYAVVDSESGDVTIHNSGDVLSSDDTETDILLKGNENMGMRNAFDMFGEYENADFTVKMNAVKAIASPI